MFKAFFERRAKAKAAEEDLLRQAERALAYSKAQEPKVNALTEWFDKRSGTDGFGSDFELSLRPKPKKP